MIQTDSRAHKVSYLTNTGGKGVKIYLHAPYSRGVVRHRAQPWDRALDKPLTACGNGNWQDMRVI